MGCGRHRAFPFHSTDMAGTSVLNGSWNSILSGAGTGLTSGRAAGIFQTVWPPFNGSVAVVRVFDGHGVLLFLPDGKWRR